MTETVVRLTATTEDGQVVYVLANAKGELKLEEPIGLEFDGNLDGDLDVTGNITAAGDVGIGMASPDARLSVLGETNGLLAKFGGSSAAYDRALQLNEFMVGGGNSVGFRFNAPGIPGNFNSSCAIALATKGTDALFVDRAQNVGIGTDNPRTKLDISGGKAGFTEEGHLFCTTTRGDLVVLENTSGGFGAWVEYTPPPAIRDQLDEMDWSEKDNSPEIKPIQD